MKLFVKIILSLVIVLIVVQGLVVDVAKAQESFSQFVKKLEGSLGVRKIEAKYYKTADLCAVVVWAAQGYHQASMFSRNPYLPEMSKFTMQYKRMNFGPGYVEFLGVEKVFCKKILGKDKDDRPKGPGGGGGVVGELVPATVTIWEKAPAPVAATTNTTHYVPEMPSWMPAWVNIWTLIGLLLLFFLFAVPAGLVYARKHK